jgi:predicted RNase H-like HicB family nuclease
MTIETNTRIWREGKHFIAHALPIDVAGAGDSPEAARRALKEALDLFIATARDQGTLDDVLEECGYTLEGGKWSAPRIVAQQQDEIPV